MDGRKRNNQNNDINWDNGIYGTGRIDPPKRRGGLLAMLLILVIFLCGVITVLGILNIRLFQQLNAPGEEEMMISFSDGGPPSRFRSRKPNPLRRPSLPRTRDSPAPRH